MLYEVITNVAKQGDGEAAQRDAEDEGRDDDGEGKMRRAERQAADPIEGRLERHHRKARHVITSYSIHYTKLYEGNRDRSHHPGPPPRDCSFPNSDAARDTRTVMHLHPALAPIKAS